MKTLKFGGSSDDTFGEITPRGDDYDNCASGEPIEWLVESKSTGERLIVVGQYAPGAATGWLVGVAPIDPDDSDEQVPTWPMRLCRPDRDGRSYSPTLEIDAPDDVTIRCLQRGGE